MMRLIAVTAAVACLTGVLVTVLRKRARARET